MDRRLRHERCRGGRKRRPPQRQGDREGRPDPHQLGTEGRRCRAPECLCHPVGQGSYLGGRRRGDHQYDLRPRCVCGLRPGIGQRTGRDPAFQHFAGDPGRRDLHQYDQGRGHTDRETHDDGDLCAAGRPRSRPRVGAQCVHRREPEEFGHVHPRDGDPHAGAQADAIRGRIGQYLPGVGSLPLFRHQGRRCEEQLHDVGAVYPG